MDENSLSDFRRKKLGFIFQDCNLLDTLTMRENTALGLVLSKVRSKEILRRVDELSETLGVT